MASMSSPWYHIVPLLSIGVPIAESAASGILNTRISEDRVAPKNCATQYIAACSIRISSNKYLEKQKKKKDEKRRRVYKKLKLIISQCYVNDVSYILNKKNNIDRANCE